MQPGIGSTTAKYTRVAPMRAGELEHAFELVVVHRADDIGQHEVRSFAPSVRACFIRSRAETILSKVAPVLFGAAENRSARSPPTG